jgi:hypothetical protein
VVCSGYGALEMRLMAICVLPEAEKRHNVLIIDTAILLGIRGDLG